MTKNRIEIVDEGAGDGPDLARFKTKPEDEAAKDDERRAKERDRARARRAKGKGKSATSAEPLEVDLATCHYANAFLLNLAGIVAKRRIEASPEQFDALDKSLQQIAQKYGGWLLEYAPEITYATTVLIVVSSSPRLEEVPLAEAHEQDRADPGSEG